MYISYSRVFICLSLCETPSLIHTHNTAKEPSGQCLHWHICLPFTAERLAKRFVFTFVHLNRRNGGRVDASALLSLVFPSLSLRPAHVRVYSMPRYWDSTPSQPFCTCVRVCKHPGVLIRTVQTKKMSGLLHDNAVIIIALVKLFDRSQKSHGGRLVTLTSVVIPDPRRCNNVARDADATGLSLKYALVPCLPNVYNK